MLQVAAPLILQDTDSHVKDAADYKKRKPYFTNKKAQQGWNGNNSLMWFYNIIAKGHETQNIKKLKGPYLLLTPFHKAGHGERSRSQLHFKLGGITKNSSILAINALAVNVLAVNSVS